jgi:hypothetical protein
MPAKIYLVTVAADYRWSTVNVGGRSFSKSGVTEVREGDLTDEIRQSPLLKVVEVDPPKRRRSRRKVEPTEEG